jgi:hypothetical protein
MEEIGMIRARSGWQALLLGAGLALTPSGVRGQDGAPPPWPVPVGDSQFATLQEPEAASDPVVAVLPLELPPRTVRAQDVGPADPVFPVPLWSPHPELGGFFFNGEFLWWRQTNPLKNQIIAIRGFQTLGGAFNGSGAPALDARDASAPTTYVPGYRFGLGYRFRNKVVVEGIYWHMFNVRYPAGATLIPPLTEIDAALNNTFLFSPVFNYPLDFVGPDGAVGIWNGAEEMTIRFEQRLDKWDLRFRIPVWESDYDPISNPNKLALRTYGLCGIRHYWLWERFKWRTVDRDDAGIAGPQDVAHFSNLISQPMYGPFVGWGFEMYRGHGIALTLDLFGGIYVNFVREIARWEREGDGTAGLLPIVGAKRSRRVYTLVPETEAHLNIWWYPIEGVQIRLGYDVMALYNTIHSPQPVDFNFNNVAPHYEHRFVRMIDGWNLGIGFNF